MFCLVVWSHVFRLCVSCSAQHSAGLRPEGLRVLFKVKEQGWGSPGFQARSVVLFTQPSRALGSPDGCADGPEAGGGGARSWAPPAPLWPRDPVRKQTRLGLCRVGLPTVGPRSGRSLPSGVRGAAGGTDGLHRDFLEEVIAEQGHVLAEEAVRHRPSNRGPGG